MKLRKLELKDAPLMLEWMHDELVVVDLQAIYSATNLFNHHCTERDHKATFYVMHK